MRRGGLRGGTGMTAVTMVAMGALLALLGAIPAQAASAPRGRYVGKTSQKLPITLYVGLAVKGQLGRFIDYTGLANDQRTRLREVATLKVRVACKGSGGPRWKEVVPIQILGVKRNRSLSGGYVLRKGRFRYAQLDLSGRGNEVLDENLKGRIRGRKASGTIQLKVTQLAVVPLVNGDFTFASCKSGRVKWSARKKRGGKGGIPKVGSRPESKPRRARYDSFFQRLIDGTEVGGDGTVAYQPFGGGAFGGYSFRKGGQLLYCRRGSDGSRDYRSGTWSVAAGYLWRRGHSAPGLADGTLRLSLGGAPVDVGVKLDGSAFTVSPSGGGLASVAARYPNGGAQPSDDCAEMEAHASSPF